MKKVPREKAHNFENSLDFAFGAGPVHAKLFTQIHSRAGFLGLNTMDIWGWRILGCGRAVLCSAGCLAAFLASTH